MPPSLEIDSTGLGGWNHSFSFVGLCAVFIYLYSIRTYRLEARYSVFWFHTGSKTCTPEY